MRHVHRSDEIHFEHTGPIRWLNVPEWKASFAAADSRCMHDMIALAELLSNRRYRAFDGREIRDIRHESRGPVLNTKLLRDGADAFVAVDERNDCSFGSKLARNRQSNSSRAADHGHNLPI
jgi:hypothetical protein